MSNITLADVYVPEQDRDKSGFDCPNCGKLIEPPWGGHTWTCHETYGGCGAKYRPAEAYKRVEGDE